ncbi:MAG: TetR family transcriptional regulator [Candidatus Moraniibacteriota bacterium]|nr:MAG: TetR family transcriptional regulator [Candidatus Moranbacteria bacterium]
MPLQKKRSILFISRAFPPVVGGIENQNYELSVWLPKITHTDTIANTRGKKCLPFFLLWLFIILPFKAPKYDVLLLGDGVLGIVSWWVKLFHKKQKVACVVHGLDLTYKNTFYQRWWVRKFIPTCDVLIAVGNQTIKEGVKRHIDKNRFVFIPNGVHPEKFMDDTYTTDIIFDVIDQKYRGKKFLLTFGRLARRKGAAWFIRTVLPHLHDDILYVIAGDGADRENVLKAIAEKKMSDRVLFLGYVDDESRSKLFHGADLFIQPNIKVPGDMEGFGITLLEAGVSGLPVLAARLEGLKDAIKDGKNGFLIESGNVTAWREKIEEVLHDDFDRKRFGKSAQQYVIDHLSWEKVAGQYYDIVAKL